MAHISDAEKEELACVYAALILHDDGLPIQADKIAILAKAAGIKVQAFWPAVFAKVLANKNVDDIIMSAGGAGVAPAAAAPAAAAPAEEKKGGKKEEPKKEEKKKEEEKKEEEEEADMGLSLFD